VIIYMAENVKSGKIYIGQTTKTLEQRRKQHVWLAKKGSQTYFHKALRKYGPGNFEWFILYHASSVTRLNVLEMYTIREYQKKDVYNLTAGGEGTKGHIKSATTRERCRQAALRRPPVTAASRLKMSESQRARRQRQGVYSKDVLTLPFREAKVKYNISKTHYYRLRKADAIH
jgi:group I intron endonuclease